MKTYWEHSEFERSKMTEDQVKDLLDLHLMERGVLKIVAPKLRTIDPDPVLKTTTMYEVGDVVFETAEKAQKFLELGPTRLNYEYAIGYDYKFPVSVGNEIKAIQVFDRQSIMDAKTVLAKNKSAKEKNEKAERKFEEDSKKMRSCLDEVWEDYYRCQTVERKHKKIADTMAEYLLLADGDSDIAYGFLKKVFTEDEIKESNEWFKNS